MFVLTHFLNHALGIWSIEAMDAIQAWRTKVTRSNLGGAVLGGALATHFTLTWCGSRGAPPDACRSGSPAGVWRRARGGIRTKEHGVQIVASSVLAEAAGLRSDAFPQEVVSVRGTTEALSVVLIARGRQLRPLLGNEPQRSAA